MSPQKITTDKGELVLSGFDEATGKVSYSYTANVLTHTGGADEHDDFGADHHGRQRQDGQRHAARGHHGHHAGGCAGHQLGDGRQRCLDGDGQRADRAERGHRVQDGTLSVASVNGTAVTASDHHQRPYGTLVIQADGLHHAEQRLPAVNQLNDGETLTETFNYVAKDGDGSTAPARW